MNLAPGLEKPPCTGTLLGRGISCMRGSPVGLGVSLLSSKPSFQFALVTTRTVQLPFFLGAREKGYHGNTSNP